MHLRMVKCIEDRKQNQSRGTGNREEDRKDGACFVKLPFVGRQLLRMSQPSLCQEGQIKKDHGDHTAANKEWLQAFCAYIGNVSVAK